MKKYLTVKDYIVSILLFLPTFILMSAILISLWGGNEGNVSEIFALMITPFILYLRLKYIAHIRERHYQMVWQAKQDFENKQDSNMMDNEKNI